jgi:probable phosphoglycerate mutase
MQPALQLVLVRHGETEWTERGLLHGRLDSPLSPAGNYHAELTAQRLSGESFDAIYTSPQGRAQQTASIIGQALGLSPSPLDGLREMNFGWAEGKPLKLVDPTGTGNWYFRPFLYLAAGFSAERLKHFATRVGSSMETMSSLHPQGRLVVVTHWGVLSMLTALLLDGDPRRWRSYGPWAACGISELHAVNGAWQVACLND